MSSSGLSLRYARLRAIPPPSSGDFKSEGGVDIPKSPDPTTLVGVPCFEILFPKRSFSSSSATVSDVSKRHEIQS